MLQIPIWILTAIGGLILVLVGTVGYLIRFVISTNEKKNEEQDERLRELRGEVRTLNNTFHETWGTVTTRFAEAERDAVKQFVGNEQWTREYVTLTNRIDAAFKKLDRVTEGKRL
jgi:NADH:ubiquinone oxidoreductase subunit 6 (subunit J)